MCAPAFNESFEKPIHRPNRVNQVEVVETQVNEDGSYNVAIKINGIVYRGVVPRDLIPAL